MPSIALILVLLTTMAAQAAMGERRHIYNRLGDTSPANLLADIQIGDLLDLGDVQLEGEMGDQTLELERFEVFSPNAEVLIHENSGVKRKPLPKGAFYHGRLQGYPDSLAVMTVDETGKTQGLVQLGERIWLLRDDQPGLRRKLRVSNKQLPAHPLPGEFSLPMRCGLDSLQQQQTTITPSVFGTPTSELEPLVAALPAGQLYQATIAIESDAEFYALFGNSNSANMYIANLFAYATTIYERETQTRLTLGQINLWPSTTTPGYPWTFNSADTGLTAFRDYWIANKKNVVRSTAHFLSGKGLNSGIAYLNALCSNDIGYGLSTSIRGNFSLENPTPPVWDIFVVTHEIGHNFNSQHTHDYQNIGGDTNPVDNCPSGNLPGLNSLTGGTPGSGNGTIMSYCHQLTGGFRNISLTFGQSPFVYGIKPYRVSDVMSGFAAQRAANFPNCLPVINNNNTYLLTVTKTGTGSGTVTSTNPANAINCGNTCAATFNAGTSVVLSASAADGSTFGSWTGCNSTNGTTCNVTMDAAKTVTANFIQTFRLSVIKTGSGTVTSTNPVNTINCGNTCAATFNAGTSVVLSASPADGYTFGSWTGCNSTNGTTCNVTMDAAKTVTANFIQTFRLSVAKTGSGTVTSTSPPPAGTINCGITCAATFNAGASVVLSASAADGYTFGSWTGCNSTNGTTCNVTMNAAKTVTANFIQTFRLSVIKTGSGTVTSTNPADTINCGAVCTYSYVSGQSVTLNAVPATGYYFSSWSGACSGSESCITTMDAAKSVTATFTAIPAGYSVLAITKTGLGSVTSFPSGITCSGTCNAVFANGTQVTLSAAPVTGYYFVGWSGACSGQGNCTLTINNDQTATANFVQIPSGYQLLNIMVNGSGSVISLNPTGLNCNAVCTYYFQTGTMISLISSANTGQTFTGWSGGWCSDRSSCIVTMTDNRSVTATFKNTYALIMPAINLLLLGD